MADGSQRDDDALSSRLDKIGAALERRKTEAEEAKRAPPAALGGAMAVGMRAMSELVAAVMVGAGLGWAIDRGLGSEPWGLVVGIAVGTIAGFWGVYRLAARSGASQGADAGGRE